MSPEINKALLGIMDFILVFACLLLISSLCYKAAVKKGRNPWIWAMVGLIFGLLGLVLISLLPSRREKPLPAVAPPAKPRPAQGPWYYLDKESNQIGPLPLEGVREAWKEGSVSEATYLWNETLEDWKQLSHLPETLTFLGDKQIP